MMDLSLRQPGPSLTPGRLDEVEREIGLRLPAEYRAFLLEHNGGTPEPATFSFRMDEDCDDGRAPAPRAGKVRKASVFRFYPAGPQAAGPPETTMQEACARLRQDDLVPGRLAAIAEVSAAWSDGTLCLSCDGEDLGRVYLRPDYLESADAGFFLVADSLHALFDLMTRSARPEETPQKRAERAVIEGDLDALARAHAEGVNPTRKNSRNETLLDLAAFPGRGRAMTFLIDHGAGLDPAFLAAVRGRNVPLVLRLLDTGKGPSKKAFITGWLSYPLHEVTELVRAFLARGADPNQTQKVGATWIPGTLATPLFGAAAAGNLEGARLLLDAGANPDATNVYGDTPLHHLAPTPGGTAVGLLLLDRGAGVNVWSLAGKTALHHVVGGHHDPELARRLIDAGEDLHATGIRRVMVDGKELHSGVPSAAMHCPPDLRAELVAYQAAKTAGRAV